MLTAIDETVITTYVRLNLVMSLIAQIAFDIEKDKVLDSRDVSHLFPNSTTYLGIRKDTFIRQFTHDFIKMFTPHMSDNELKNFLQKRHI